MESAIDILCRGMVIEDEATVVHAGFDVSPENCSKRNETATRGGRLVFDVLHHRVQNALDEGESNAIRVDTLIQKLVFVSGMLSGRMGVRFPGVVAPSLRNIGICGGAGSGDLTGAEGLGLDAVVSCPTCKY